MDGWSHRHSSGILVLGISLLCLAPAFLRDLSESDSKSLDRGGDVGYWRDAALLRYEVLNIEYRPFTHLKKIRLLMGRIVSSLCID